MCTSLCAYVCACREVQGEIDVPLSKQAAQTKAKKSSTGKRRKQPEPEPEPQPDESGDESGDAAAAAAAARHSPVDSLSLRLRADSAEAEEERPLGGPPRGGEREERRKPTQAKRKRTEAAARGEEAVENDDDYILSVLFSKNRNGGEGAHLHSAFSHDRIENANTAEADLVELKAQRLAGEERLAVGVAGISAQRSQTLPPFCCGLVPSRLVSSRLV